MWEAIASVLKIFLEKYLIPTVISVVGGILALLYLPEEYSWMTEKIGKVTIVILVAGLIFLLIEFIFLICKIGRKIYSKLNMIKSNNKYKIENEKQVIEALWKNVESLSADDRELLIEFIENGNNPIERSSGIRYSFDSLLNSKWVVSIEEYKEDEKLEFVLSEKSKGKSIAVNPAVFYGGKTTVKKYKLNDEIYKLLKYSMDKYGKITHF